MYERGGGKTAKHSWVSEADTIGSLSYLPIQVWQHHRQRNFRAACGATMKLNLPRFSHLPAAAFLHYIPSSSIRSMNNGEFLELDALLFQQVYTKLQAQKSLIVAAVGQLLARRRRKGTEGGDDDD